MRKFDKATCVSPLRKSILLVRLSKNLSGSEVSLIPQFINIVSILYLY